MLGKYSTGNGWVGKGKDAGKHTHHSQSAQLTLTKPRRSAPLPPPPLGGDSPVSADTLPVALSALKPVFAAYWPEFSAAPGVCTVRVMCVWRGSFIFCAIAIQGGYDQHAPNCSNFMYTSYIRAGIPTSILRMKGTHTSCKYFQHARPRTTFTGQEGLTRASFASVGNCHPGEKHSAGTCAQYTGRCEPFPLAAGHVSDLGAVVMRALIGGEELEWEKWGWHLFPGLQRSASSALGGDCFGGSVLRRCVCVCFSWSRVYLRASFRVLVSGQ